MLLQWVSQGQMYRCRRPSGVHLVTPRHAGAKAAGSRPASPLEAICQTRLDIGERDIGRAFREMNRQAPTWFERRGRAHGTPALRIEQGRIAAFERALR